METRVLEGDFLSPIPSASGCVSGNLKQNKTKQTAVHFCKTMVFVSIA